MLDRKRRVKTTISPPLTFNLKVDFTFSVPSKREGSNYHKGRNIPHKGYSLPSLLEGTEKLKPTFRLKVDDGEIAVLPFIICLF